MLSNSQKQIVLCTCSNTHCQPPPTPHPASVANWSHHHNLPIIPITFQGVPMEALLDSGSQIPLIADHIYQQAKDNILDLREESLQAFSCNGGKLDIESIATGNLQLHQNDTPIAAEFYILKQSTQDCILPHTWLGKLKAKLDWQTQTLTYELPQDNCILKANGSLEPLTEVSKEKLQLILPNKQAVRIPPTAQASIVLPSKTPQMPKFLRIGACHGFVKYNKTQTKQILTILNSSADPITILPHATATQHPPPNLRVMPTRIRTRIVQQAITDKPAFSQELQEQEALQSQYDHSSKSTANLPISKQKISFTLPSPLQDHPFNKKSDQLSILYVYIVYLIGTNLQYHNKSPEELSKLIKSNGTGKHKRLAHSIYKHFEKAQIQHMYMKISLHIVYMIHHCFLDFQKKHDTAKSTTTKASYKREGVTLNTQMNTEIKSLIALYFLNQALIHKFYCDTLQHPYFRKIEFPQSLQDLLQNLQQPHANAIQIPIPIRRSTQQSLNNTLAESTVPYAPQQLNFDQYKEATQKSCHDYTQQYNRDMSQHASPYSSPPTNISEVQSSKLQHFIEYNKSPRRLADFLSEQIPETAQYVAPKETVSEILDKMPIPKWVYYSTIQEVLNDYIPPCLTKEFEEFFVHFTDPVFIKLSGMHALPFPPTNALLASDPPDPLHSVNGLVDPKVLAATASQFLTSDHAILQPQYKKELTLLACVLFIFGQTGLSLHSLDTGKFKQAFEVKTILASTAPTSSHPPRQSTDTVTPDLDERIEFLAQQGKAVEILGSPYLAQLSSVPKNYKTSKIFTTETLDPVLKYITKLPKQAKCALSTQSQEFVTKQQQLIKELDMNSSTQAQTAKEPTQLEAPQVQHILSNQNQTLTPQLSLLKDFISQFTIVDLKSKQPLFSSKEPPTVEDTEHFFKELEQPITFTRQPSRVKFKYAFFLITEDPADLREYRQRVQYSKYHREYFYAPQDFNSYNTRQVYQSVASKSKNLLRAGKHSQLYGAYQNEKQHNTAIRFNTSYFPNAAQLAKHKLNPNIADHQQYLSACNNIHFAITQFSAQLPLNRFVDDQNPNYNLMHRLALSPEYLAQAQAHNPTNEAPQQLIHHCMHIAKAGQNCFNKIKYNHIEKNLAKIHIQTHNTRKFMKLISLLNTSMRQIDHKRALKTNHSLKQNITDFLTKSCPHLQDQWEKLSLQDILSHYSGWPQLMKAISQHYQVPIIWLETEIIHNAQLFQNANILSLHIVDPQLYDTKVPAFAVIAFNPTSIECYGVRSNTTAMKILLQAAQANKVGTKITVKEALQHIKPMQQTVKSGMDTAGDLAEPNSTAQPPPATAEQHNEGSTRPRFTKTPYPHLNKAFYQKNAISRFILNSRDTNKLTRPTDTHMQSQSSIINNLGSSEMFSNYDLTSAFDALPACPISSLINTASYRQKEISFLIASMGGSNSVLFCQRAVNSLLHRLDDQLLLRPCYKPHPIQGLDPALEKAVVDEARIPLHLRTEIPIAESWSGNPLLHLPSPRLIKHIQNSLMHDARNISPHHYIPMSPTDRHRLLNQNTKDTVLSTSALIDDVVCSSKQINSPEYQALSNTEQTRLHFQIHIQILLTLFQAINTLSQDPGPGPTKFKATLKLKLEKSCFATTSIRYLNLIYIKGYQVINTDNFKKSCKYLDTLPSNGDELRSALGFTNYLLAFTKSLRYLVKNLESFAAKHPAKKAIQWDQHPTLKQEYNLLCQTIKASNCLHTLPSDLNQLDKVVFSTDACSASLSYCIAFSLKPLPLSPRNTPLKLLRYYSSRLPDHCQNLTILLKECISAVLCLIQETALLKLLPPGSRKYLIIDSQPLFDLLSKYLNNGQLNAFFTAHATIPLWISRLYQFLMAHSITLLLVPTKLNAPADFLTRKVHSVVACQGTHKRTPCKLCPGCNSHCVRSTPHSGCPYAIGSASNISKPPRLITFNKVKHHSVKIDNEEVAFQSLGADFDPSDYVEYDLAKPLQVLGNSHSLSVEPQEMIALYDELVDIDTMLKNSQEQHQVLNDTIQALQARYVKSNSISSRHSAAPTVSPKRHTMPDQIYIYTDYNPRALHSLPVAEHTAVIHFTVQKKSWNKPNEYFSRILAQTAIARMDFNIGQVETVQIDGIAFIVLCADTNATPPYLALDTLFTNIHSCLRKVHMLKFIPHKIVLDYESIKKVYQILPTTLVKALSLISEDNSCTAYQYEIYNYNPAPPFHEGFQQLEITVPIIHNQVRKEVLTIPIGISDSLAVVYNNIKVRLEELIPTTKLPTTKTAIVHNRSILPLTATAPITAAQLILVKDHTYQPKPETNVYFAQHNHKPLIVIKADIGTQLLWGKPGPTQDWTILETSHTVQQELFGLTNRSFTAFQMPLEQPLATKFYPWVVQYNNFVSPKLNTKMPIPTFTELLLENPQTQQLQFYTTTAVQSIARNKEQDLQSPEHMLQQLLGKHTNIILAQAADPTIQELTLKTKNNKGPLVIQQCMFNIFDNILFGKYLAPTQNVSTMATYRPVIAQSQLIPEILQTHKRLKCAPPLKVLHDINARYLHHKGITSDIALETLIKDFIPCHVCLLGRAAHVTAPLYMKTQSIGLESLGIRNCNLISNDVFYLSKGPNPHFKEPYLSVIVCNTCRFISLQPISEITSANLASHILDFCQLSGKIPHVIISDAASTQTGSEIKKILSDFFIIHVTANRRDLYERKELPHPSNTLADGKDSQLFTEEDTKGLCLDQITENQKQLLLQDIQKSNPSLYNTVLSHHPASYKASQLNRETSLGSLDSVCKRLKAFLQKFLLDKPTDSSLPDHVEHLIKAFQFMNNFKYKAAYTKQIPAILHLGLLRHTTITNMMKNISSIDAASSQAVITWQQILKYADNFRQAEINAQECQSEQQKRQLKQHGRLLDKEAFLQSFTPFTVLFAKAEYGSVPKLHTYDQFIGPYIIISVNPHSNTLYLYSLLSAEIHKTSYRHVRKAFNAPSIFSTPLFGQLGDGLQFNFAEKFSHLHKQISHEQTSSDIQKILVNLHKLITLVAPILPSMLETRTALTLTLNDANDSKKSIEDVPGDEFDISTQNQAIEPKPHQTEETLTRNSVKFTFHDDPPNDMIQDVTHQSKALKQIPIRSASHLPSQPTEVVDVNPTQKQISTRTETTTTDISEDTPRAMKYSLRQQPRRNPKFM